jgi:hypothetical protein
MSGKSDPHDPPKAPIAFCGRLGTWFQCMGHDLKGVHSPSHEFQGYQLQTIVRYRPFQGGALATRLSRQPFTCRGVHNASLTDIVHHHVFANFL